MAITRTQIARQLYRDAGYVQAAYGKSAAKSGPVERNSDRGRDTSNFIDPDPEVNIPTRNRQDTITSFTKNLGANFRSNPFSFLTPIGTGIKTALQTNQARKMLGYTSPTTPTFNDDTGESSQMDSSIPLWAQLGFNNEAEYLTSLQAQETMDQESEVEEPFEVSRRFRAEGGIMNNNVVGGEMDFESARQMYGLGKLVKKVTRGIKKIAKSPIGKAALAFGTYKLGGGFLKDKGGISGIFDLIKANPYKSIFGLSALSGLMTKEEEEEKLNQGADLSATPRFIMDNPQLFQTYRTMAEGGSTEEKEPVAKKVMPLLDMDGQEKDYRETGGFVDMGRMEKADDVPARLSKNEFVFTADAVRNAGDGSVDKGAEVMYNMMKNLESGGEVSKESQGLEGAREMFQTSQRLEEVL